jgi:hypothetical protein
LHWADQGGSLLPEVYHAHTMSIRPVKSGKILEIAPMPGMDGP